MSQKAKKVTKSKKAPTKSSNNSVVHERGAGNQHRIVVFKLGIPLKSAWFEHHQIAVFGVHRASFYENGTFPAGIFKISAVAHEVL